MSFRKRKAGIFQKCCLKFKVIWVEEDVNEKYFFYCLHCGQIFSWTGMYYHRENADLSDEEINSFAIDFFANIERHKFFVKMECERRFVNGRMFHRSRVPLCQRTQPPITCTLIPTPQTLLPRVRPQRRPQPQYPREDGPVRMEVEDEEIQELNFDEIFEFPRLLDCLSSDGFDPQRFERNAEDYSDKMMKRQTKVPKMSKRKRHGSSLLWPRTST